jgi:hypothetical protein
VKAPSSRVGPKVLAMTLFALAFIAGASVVFGLAALAGAATRFGLSLEWRLRIAAVSLIALGLIDVVALRRGTYCPIGLKRQTPKSLLHRFGGASVFAVWGFDTGLAVTTFRVAAVTWGALLLTALGFASWWMGLSYGAAFVVPLLVLLVLPADVRTLEARLSRRPIV